MHLKKLSLINYKNFESQEFELDTKINCLVGNNGVGKTNVLDAIYHLSVGKSYFNPVATQNIRHGNDFFVIDGEFEKNDRTEKIICSLKKGNKKIIKRNGKAYDKLSDHVGFLPLVIISPADRDLIIEGSDTRRRFIDNVISQQNKEYLNTLITYNKVLQQRNALLKYFAANNTFNADNLEIYDQQLTELSKPIYNARKEFLEVFVPIFIERYKSISSGSEQVGLTYKSHLHDAGLNELLKQHINRDKALQFTSQGIHKDDLSFEIAEYPIKKFGSQGQQKSFLIALKLAQFDFIKEKAGVRPILLLDDIFDKLDEERVSHIVSLLEDDHFGQLFISDTHAERTEEVVSKTHQSYKIFKL